MENLKQGDTVLVEARIDRLVPPDHEGGEILVVLSVPHGLASFGRTDQTTQVVVSPSVVHEAATA